MSCAWLAAGADAAARLRTVKKSLMWRKAEGDIPRVGNFRSRNFMGAAFVQAGWTATAAKPNLEFTPRIKRWAQVKSARWQKAGRPSNVT